MVKKVELPGMARTSSLFGPLFRWEFDDVPGFTYVPEAFFNPERTASYREDWVRRGQPLPSDIDLASKSIMWGNKKGRADLDDAYDRIFGNEIERWREFLCNFTRPRAFAAEEGVAQLLSLTKASNRQKRRRLPFPDIWLEGNFKTDDVQFFGIRAWEVDLTQSPFPADGGDGEIRVDACFVYRQERWPQTTIHKGKPMPLEIGGEPKDFDQFEVVRDVMSSDAKAFLVEDHLGANRRQMNFIRDVLMNWLDFLESPQTVNRPATLSRQKRDQQERAMDGRAPTEVVRIVITDERLRRDVAAGIGNARYSHAFWVRGHWRTLRAEQYRENIGKRIWVAPHVKGEGILVEKKYQVAKDYE